MKDKTGDINSADNYRGITLTTVISKLSECVLLANCEESLATDDLQFGFKRSLGCQHAVFTLRSGIDHFTSIQEELQCMQVLWTSLKPSIRPAIRSFLNDSKILGFPLGLF